MSNNSSGSSQRLAQAPSSQAGLSLIELMEVTATATQDVFTAKRTETYGPVGLYGGHFQVKQWRRV